MMNVLAERHAHKGWMYETHEHYYGALIWKGVGNAYDALSNTLMANMRDMHIAKKMLIVAISGT